MKKVILLSFIILISTLSSFAIDCKKPYKVGSKTFCLINGYVYDLKSYAYDEKADIYSINVLYDLITSDDHQTYKVPNNKSYIAYLIFRTYYDNNKISAKCIGYITGDLKVFYHEDGSPEYADYVNTKIYMEKPKGNINIAYFQALHLDYLNKNRFIEVIQSMADSH